MVEVRNPAGIIAKKRDGGALTPEEIGWFVRGYAEDRIADYQMAALAMAICIQGMEPVETAYLTREIVAFGVSFSAGRLTGSLESTSIQPAGSATRSPCCWLRCWPAAICRSP